MALASLVDEECQDYGAFTLAFLANNKSFQVPLVKMGGVRPLVSMMAKDSESKHYVALSLLKLADNFENHVTIAGKRWLQKISHVFVILTLTTWYSDNPNRRRRDQCPAQTGQIKDFKRRHAIQGCSFGGSHGKKCMYPAQKINGNST